MHTRLLPWESRAVEEAPPHSWSDALHIRRITTNHHHSPQPTRPKCVVTHGMCVQRRTYHFRVRTSNEFLAELSATTWA
ncbi:hypothetical protein ACKKBG_A28145 [Auxenochlorella protothecoides x Auxenochlorella symbiontica]